MATVRQTNPTNFLLLLGNNIHGHQDVQGIVDSAANVLLIIILKGRSQTPQESESQPIPSTYLLCSSKFLHKFIRYLMELDQFTLQAGPLAR